MFLLSFLACEAFYIGVKDEAVEDTAEIISPPLQIDIDWDDDFLRIKASNVEGYGNIKLGIVEVSNECEDDLENGCWTGEDCHNGYPPPEGQESSERYTQCHLLPSTDAEYGNNSWVSSLAYSSQIENVATVDDAIENLNVPIGNGNTAFPAPTESLNYETKVSYYLQAEIIGEEGENPIRCWTWGVDPSYFDGLNPELQCNTPLPVSFHGGQNISITLE